MDVNAIIRGIIPFDVSGETYFTIYFVHESDPDEILEARLPSSSIYHHPHVNDRIRVHYVFQMPTRIERAKN